MSTRSQRMGARTRSTEIDELVQVPNLIELSESVDNLNTLTLSNFFQRLMLPFPLQQLVQY